MGGERRAERLEVLGPQRQPGGGPVAAEALQVLGACLERGVQVEAGDAATGAAPSALAVEGDDDDRTVVALDQPRGDDPDHAGMPALARERPARALPSAPRAARAAPLRPPSSTSRSVARRSELARLSSSAICFARASSSVSSSSTPASARYSRPAALIRGASRNAEVALVQPSRLAFRGLHQRSAARPACVRPHLGQPALDERPVLPDQRHHVGDRRQRHEVEVLSVGFSPAQRARQLPGHRGPAQRLEGVASRLPGEGSGSRGSSSPRWW